MATPRSTILAIGQIIDGSYIEWGWVREIPVQRRDPKFLSHDCTEYRRYLNPHKRTEEFKETKVSK